MSIDRIFKNLSIWFERTGWGNFLPYAFLREIGYPSLLKKQTNSIWDELTAVDLDRIAVLMRYPEYSSIYRPTLDPVPGVGGANWQKWILEMHTKFSRLLLQGG